MPERWYLVPYTYQPPAFEGDSHKRRNPVAALYPQMKAEGGPHPPYAYTEIAGNQMLLKARASDALLDQIAALPGVMQIPPRWARLIDSFSDMTNGERNQIQNRLLAAEYTQAEINEYLGTSIAEWRTKTFQDFVELVCLKRHTPALEGGELVARPPFRAVGAKPQSIDAKVVNG